MHKPPDPSAKKSAVWADGVHGWISTRFCRRAAGHPPACGGWAPRSPDPSASARPPRSWPARSRAPRRRVPIGSAQQRRGRIGGHGRGGAAGCCIRGQGQGLGPPDKHMQTAAWALPDMKSLQCSKKPILPPPPLSHTHTSHHAALSLLCPCAHKGGLPVCVAQLAGVAVGGGATARDRHCASWTTVVHLQGWGWIGGSGGPDDYVTQVAPLLRAPPSCALSEQPSQQHRRRRLLQGLRLPPSPKQVPLPG